MKKYMYAFGGTITAIILIVVATFIGRKLFHDTPENRETVPYSYESGETNASGEPLEGMLVISAEEDFMITRELDDGSVIVAVKNPPREPYILKVPASLGGKTVGFLEKLSNDPYVYEVIFYNEGNTGGIEECDNLRKITFPKDVTRVASILNCKRLTEIVFPENEDFTHMVAIGSLDSLQSVQLPDSITYLAACFSRCPLLVSAELPQNLQAITGSFSVCPELQYVDIPDSVTEIDHSFVECPKLTLYVGRGTVAEQYAKENNIPYKYHGEGVEIPSVEIPSLEDMISGKNLTYAVMPGDALWNRSSHTELMQMLQVSMEYTEQYTTRELLELCIQYPFFGDFLAYDTIAEGIAAVTASHNYFQTLLSREDVTTVATDYYQNLNMNVWTMNSEYPFLRLQFVEALMAESGMLKGVAKETLRSLAEKALEYMQYMEKIGDTCPEGSILYQYIADTLGLPEEERVIKPVGIEGVVIKMRSMELSVYTYQEDYSDDARIEMKFYIQRAYPRVARIGVEGMYTNSHGYALIGDEQGWLPRDQMLKYYNEYNLRSGTSTDQSLLQENGKMRGDVYNIQRVSYKSHSHSALVMSGTLLQSKWGRYGVYVHEVTECPYDASALTFYNLIN